MLPSQPNNSLILGFACFQEIVGAEGPLGSRELARRLGVTPTRANRILGTLAHIGMVEKTAKSKYGVGPGVHVLAAQGMKASRLLPVALPALLEWRKEGFTVALGVLWREKVSYLFHERPWQNFEEALALHEPWPVEYSSLGMALLAAQPGKITAPPPQANHGANLLPGQGFAASIKEARRTGYALRRYTSGEVSIGVAIGVPAVAGIAVSNPYLSDDAIPLLAARLTKAAEEMARRLAQPLPRKKK